MEKEDIEGLLNGKWKVSLIQENIEGKDVNADVEKCLLTNNEEGTIVHFENESIYDSDKRCIVKQFEVLKKALYIEKEIEFGYLRFFSPKHCRYEILLINETELKLRLYRWGSIEIFAVSIHFKKLNPGE